MASNRTRTLKAVLDRLAERADIDGQRVCKVGPYDGHVTVAHAYGDPALLDSVFC